MCPRLPQTVSALTFCNFDVLSRGPYLDYKVFIGTRAELHVPTVFRHLFPPSLCVSVQARLELVAGEIRVVLNLSLASIPGNSLVGNMSE